MLTPALVFDHEDCAPVPVIHTVEAPAHEVLDRTRSGRYAARYVLWDDSGLRRVRMCGRAPQSAESGVVVRVSENADGTRSAGWGGVQHCGSVWACPVCSAKIAEQRRLEIAQALTEHGRRGGRVALATFTMRHRKGQRLKTLWDALAYAWSKMTSGRGWGSDKALCGIKGWLRVVEVTEGCNGWHVHVHALVFLGGGAGADAWRDPRKAAAYLEESMYGRWADALSRKGLTALRSVGAKVQLLDGDPGDALGDYFTKAVYRASMEAARGDLKTGRKGGRTPFEILADFVASGDLDDLDTWQEWERVSKGRRQIGWSKGLRADLLAGQEELTDEEIAEAATDGEIAAQVDGPLFKAVVRARGLLPVLEAFERSHQEGAAVLMTYAPLAEQIEAATAAAAAALGTGRRRWRRR